MLCVRTARTCCPSRRRRASRSSATSSTWRRRGSRGSRCTWSSPPPISSSGPRSSWWLWLTTPVTGSKPRTPWLTRWELSGARGVRSRKYLIRCRCIFALFTPSSTLCCSWCSTRTWGTELSRWFAVWWMLDTPETSLVNLSINLGQTSPFFTCRWLCGGCGGCWGQC